MINIPKNIKKKIKEHALESQPKECCGFLISKGDKVDILKCNNKSALDNKFSIDPVDYLKASKMGEIVSVYHSHNDDNVFSEYDKFNSNVHNLDYILYCIKEDNFLHYIANSSFNHYMGRKFEMGKQDCLTLVRDFYKNELDIHIKNHAPCRGLDWKEKFGDFFDKHFRTEGFIEVQDIKKYDGILFKFHREGHSSHCAIYLGDGLMLHQPRNNMSKIDEYDNRYKKLTSSIVRHKKFI